MLSGGVARDMPTLHVLCGGAESAAGKPPTFLGLQSPGGVFLTGTQTPNKRTLERIRSFVVKHDPAFGRGVLRFVSLSRL